MTKPSKPASDSETRPIPELTIESKQVLELNVKKLHIVLPEMIAATEQCDQKEAQFIAYNIVIQCCLELMSKHILGTDLLDGALRISQRRNSDLLAATLDELKAPPQPAPLLFKPLSQC